MKHSNSLKLPSGRSVNQCKRDAKRLAKEKSIKLHEALCIIANRNGAENWESAIKDAIEIPGNSTEYTIEQLFSNFRKEQKAAKKYLINTYGNGASDHYYLENHETEEKHKCYQHNGYGVIVFDGIVNLVQPYLDELSPQDSAELHFISKSDTFMNYIIVIDFNKTIMRIYRLRPDNTQDIASYGWITELSTFGTRHPTEDMSHFHAMVYLIKRADYDVNLIIDEHAIS